MSEDWRDHHANESGKALSHPMVARVLDEQRGNLGIVEGTLQNYALLKIAMYAAQVARAQALGFDPDLLRMTPDEANAEMMRRAEVVARAGVPVWVFEAGEGESEGS